MQRIDKKGKSSDTLQDQPPHRALADLYLRYREELVAFVRRKVGMGPPEPEDVVQQAFANFTAISDKAAVRNPRAFLYRTTANILINDQKRETSNRKQAQRLRAEKENIPDRYALTPETVLSDREELAAVTAVVRKMPQHRRRLLLLHRVEGLSYAEIGRRVGLSEAAIRKNVAIAVKECGAALETLFPQTKGKDEQ